MAALVRIYVAFYRKDYKTDEQFAAMDFAADVFKRNPEEKRKAFEALELAGIISGEHHGG